MERTRRRSEPASELLPAEGHGVAAPETQGGAAGRLLPVLQGVQERREDTRAGGADRVAEGDGAPVHVHAVPVPPEGAPGGAPLDRERFVRLDQIVVAALRLGLRQELLHGHDRCEEQILGLAAGARIRSDTGQGFQAVSFRERQRRDDQCARAVVQAGRVPRRHGPALLERRLERGQRCERGVLAGTLVLLDHRRTLLPGNLDRDRFRLEAARLHRRHGLLVARQREPDRKSTRLNSSHLVISYAVFCLKKKKSRSKIASKWEPSGLTANATISAW